MPTTVELTVNISLAIPAHEFDIIEYVTIHAEIGSASNLDTLGFCCQKLITDKKDAIAGNTLNQPLQVSQTEKQAQPKNTSKNGRRSIPFRSVAKKVLSRTIPMAATAAPE